MDSFILIGFMGAGKSTIGKILAKSLKCEFIDTDSAIETKEGMSINSIFQKYGEEYFRNAETELLKLLSGKKAVIATGGGMPMREINRKLIKESGKVVFLRAKDETLIDRLSGDTQRPLLKGDIKERIKTIRAQREETYTKLSDYIVDTDDKTPEETAETIVKELA